VKGAYANPDHSLLQNEHGERLELLLVLCKAHMSTILGYDGPAHPFSTPIKALTAISTASYNHLVAGIRNCESMFHLAGTIVGGCDLIKEFVAANIWLISHGWAPTKIMNFNIN
jgi:hypothetical protein